MISSPFGKLFKREERGKKNREKGRKREKKGEREEKKGETYWFGKKGNGKEKRKILGIYNTILLTII